MKKISKTRKARVWAPAFAAFAVSCAVPAQSQDLGKALETCASIAEDDARLTCFDALAALLVVGQDTEQPVALTAAPAVVAATPAAGPVPLTDEVGKERVELPQAEDREKYASRVKSCQESVQSGQTYFTLENGQVWKQSNYRRLSFRNCEFDIEISKSTFGYSMYIPSKDRKVRVARVK